MNVKRLKELLAQIDDETEIFIRNSVNPVGNIDELRQIEKSTYGFFGESVPCVILNTSSSKALEFDEDENILEFLAPPPKHMIHKYLTGELGTGKASYGEVPGAEEIKKTIEESENQD